MKPRATKNLTINNKRNTQAVRNSTGKPRGSKGLGRGLSALIPDGDMEFLSRVARGEDSISARLPAGSVPSGAAPPASSSRSMRATEKNGQGQNKGKSDVIKQQSDSVFLEADANNIQWVKLESIEANPYQPRRTFAPEEMANLVASIKEHGVLQPIILRPTSDSADTVAYQLVAGERRWRAAQQAELAHVPAIVRDVNDQQALELALIENIQRHDISALDAAHAYRRLSQEFQLSQEKVAERVGKSRSAVANTLRLLELPDEMQLAIEEGKVSEGHGRALLAAANDGSRRALFRRIVRDGLSVREAERMARESASEQPSKSEGNAEADEILTAAELKDIEQRLQRSVGTRLSIKPKKRGGQIVMEYFSLEELDRLVEILTK